MRSFRAVATLSLLYFVITSAAAQNLIKMGELRLAPFGFSAFCVEKPKRCTSSPSLIMHMTRERWRELADVNAAVNRSISPFVDGSITRPWRDDATIGDCKDYALAKRSQLIDRGFPAGALSIARGRVPGGDMHAVLLVATDRGHLVLDNLQPAILPYRSLPYRWHDIMPPENPRQWRQIISWLWRNPEPFLFILFWRFRLRRPRSIALKQHPRDRAEVSAHPGDDRCRRPSR